MARKKAYVVYPRTKEVSIAGLQTKGGKKKFRGGSFLNVSENGAAELRETYSKKDLHIVEDDQLSRALNGEKWDITDNKVKTLHNYHFGPSKQYADAWEEFEKRRADKVVDDGYEWVLTGKSWRRVKIPTFDEVQRKRKARREKLAAVTEMT